MVDSRLTFDRTGATGYIGGDALRTIHTAHPDYDITVLVRTKDKGEIVRGHFPNIRLVYGTLDDFDLLADEASKADITCHLASCEHEAAAKAVAEGVSRNPTGYLIHLSGADYICFPDLNSGTYGKRGDRVFNDLMDCEEILALPNKAPHREVDLAILEAAKKGSKTAIVCPPTIYGPGRGPGNQRSIQLPELVSRSLQRGSAITVNGGDNVWNSVHVRDLSKLFLLLVEDAAGEGDDKADWGINGFYFAENGDFSWRALAEGIAQVAEAQGISKGMSLDSLTVEEADSVWEYGSFLWGTNSRSKAVRARDVLGWEPTEVGIIETIPDVVQAESAALGLIRVQQSCFK